MCCWRPHFEGLSQQVKLIDIYSISCWRPHFEGLSQRIPWWSLLIMLLKAPFWGVTQSRRKETWIWLWHSSWQNTVKTSWKINDRVCSGAEAFLWWFLQGYSWRKSHEGCQEGAYSNSRDHYIFLNWWTLSLSIRVTPLLNHTHNI